MNNKHTINLYVILLLLYTCIQLTNAKTFETKIVASWTYRGIYSCLHSLFTNVIPSNTKVTLIYITHCCYFCDELHTLCMKLAESNNAYSFQNVVNVSVWLLKQYFFLILEK